MIQPRYFLSSRRCAFRRFRADIRATPPRHYAAFRLPMMAIEDTYAASAIADTLIDLSLQAVTSQ